MTWMANMGSEKVVAATLGISRKTVQELVGRARKRMGIPTRLAAIIKWDRWVNQQQVEA